MIIIFITDWTDLAEAAYDGKTTKVRDLIQQGVNLDDRSGSDGKYHLYLYLNTLNNTCIYILSKYIPSNIISTSGFATSKL